MTTPAGSPTWYDVLGVTRDATPEEIKAAWRHATDRFEPGSGSGQFRMFNDAADVLLDPDRRREYDATLGAPESDQDATSAPGVRDGPEPASAVTTPAMPPSYSAPAPTGDRERRGPSWGFLAVLGGLNAVVLGLLALLTVLVLVASLFAGVKVHQKADVGTATDEAPAAAERAVKALFSYDYRDLAADRKRAQQYLDPAFAKKYLRNFDALEKQKDGSPGLAVQSKAVVTASVQSSGVVDAEADVARVLVFVNVVSRKASGDPQIFQNRVAMTMRKEGDRWLVSNVNSY